MELTEYERDKTILALIRLERTQGVSRVDVLAIAGKIGAVEQLQRLVPYWFRRGAGESPVLV